MEKEWMGGRKRRRRRKKNHEIVVQAGFGLMAMTIFFYWHKTLSQFDVCTAKCSQPLGY